MAELWRSIGFGRLGLPIPTVGRDVASGQFIALSEEIKLAMRKAAVDAINDFTVKIAHESLAEVPKGPRHGTHAGEFEAESLAGSIHYPNNDPATHADLTVMWASIAYDARYAHAQHEGFMVYTRDHPVVPAAGGGFFEDESRTEEISIVWEVHDYTTPGTKSHFLSDPLKANIPRMEAYVGARVRAVFSG